MYANNLLNIPRNAIVLMGTLLLIAVAVIGSLAIQPAAADNPHYPAPGGASGVHAAACNHHVVGGVYPAPGGASGVSTSCGDPIVGSASQPAVRG